MIRTKVAAASLLAVVALSSPALAQSQAALADQANADGKALMMDEKYDEAAEKFRDAAARTNEPKYFMNLCTAYFQGGRFSQALTACNNVKNSSPSPEQAEKADTLIAKIKEEAGKQGLSLEPAGGGGGDPSMDPNNPGPGPAIDPNNPNPGPGPGPGPGPQQPEIVGSRPQVNVYQAQKPDRGKYNWSLGVDLYAGGGKIGRRDTFGTASGGFRVKSDYMLNQASRLGAQGWISYTQLAPGEDDIGDEYDLSIVDIGAALYKHICPPNTSRLCLTPLVGVQLAMFNPDGTFSNGDGSSSETFEYMGVGGRAEIRADLALGVRNEHVVGVALGANAYSKALATPSFMSDAGAALDRGGVAAHVSIGYTYRFNTPFGRAAVVSLE